MELKYRYNDKQKFNELCSNRTFMELKSFLKAYLGGTVTGF